MNGVAAEFAIEVLVHFEEGDVDVSAGEKHSEHRATWSATNDAARRTVRSMPTTVSSGLGWGGMLMACDLWRELAESIAASIRREESEIAMACGVRVS